MSKLESKADKNQSNQLGQPVTDRQDLIKSSRRPGSDRKMGDQGKRFHRYKNFRPKDPEQPSWTPWLLIRGSLTDMGVRPLPLTGIFHWWTSPDIWIEPHGNIVANEDNFVHVRIFNLGMADAIPVRVDFYWAPPSISLSAATANLIGTEWVTIPSLTSVDVRCSTSHRPISSIPIFAETLIVECSNPILDPITCSFQPILDRHVGPYNIVVIPETPGGTIELSLNIHNPFPLGVKMAVSAQIEHVFVTDAGKKLDNHSLINQVIAYGAFTSNTHQGLRRYLVADRSRTPYHQETARRVQVMLRDKTSSCVRGFREFAHPIRGSAHIRSQLSDYSTIVRPVQAGQYLSNLLLAMDEVNSEVQCFDARREIPLQDVTLKPFEQRRLEFELMVPANAHSGEYIVFYLTQRAEDMLIGGYTVVAQVADQQLEHAK